MNRWNKDDTDEAMTVLSAEFFFRGEPANLSIRGWDIQSPKTTSRNGNEIGVNSPRVYHILCPAWSYSYSFSFSSKEAFSVK